MSKGRRGRDDRLLDELGKFKGLPLSGTLWRVAREGREALDGSRGSGRWSPSTLDVLYTCDHPDGAVAEMYFHLNRGQSVFPSRMRHNLFELEVRAERTLVLANMAAVASLGVDERRYNEVLYDRTQEIGDAAAFLGFDGLVAPSARYDCNTVVLFLTELSTDDIEVVSENPVDWADWRAKRRS